MSDYQNCQICINHLTYLKINIITSIHRWSIFDRSNYSYWVLADTILNTEHVCVENFHSKSCNTCEIFTSCSSFDIFLEVCNCIHVHAGCIICRLVQILSYLTRGAVINMYLARIHLSTQNTSSNCIYIYIIVCMFTFIYCRYTDLEELFQFLLWEPDVHIGA